MQGAKPILNLVNEETYKKLKKRAEDARAAADRAHGARDQLLKRLKEEFNCEDLKEAKEMLVELEEKRDRAKKAFDAQLLDYEERWEGL